VTRLAGTVTVPVETIVDPELSVVVTLVGMTASEAVCAGGGEEVSKMKNYGVGVL
jgi:hypothetical protein